MLGRNGFIFSLDAIIAIIMAGIILLACFFYLSQTSANPYENQNIYIVSLDGLTVLEKDDTLKTAVETSTTADMLLFLNSISDQLCGNITIYTSASASVISAQKTGCTAKNESAIAMRSFIANNNIYYAKMEGWYK